MNPMFYFLLAITTVLAVTANAGGPVLDINGDIIFDGSYYNSIRLFHNAQSAITIWSHSTTIKSLDDNSSRSSVMRKGEII
ncbi:hypothetical protein YC2023_023174 [Brassica napus]